MLQLSVLRDQTDFVLAGLAKKHYPTGPADVAAILELDLRRRSLQTSHDAAQAEANELARQIGGLMKAGDKAGAEALKVRTAELKQHTQAAAAELAQVEEGQKQLLFKLPNLPHASVPQGRSAQDNEVVREHGT